MTVARKAVIDNLSRQPRNILPGEAVLSAERVVTLDTVDAGTLTARLLLSGILNRAMTSTGAYSDTTASASEIIAAMLGNYFVGSAIGNGGPGSAGGVDTGTTFRLEYINNGTGNTATILAGTGVTLTGTMTIANNTVRTLLGTVLNGTPQQVFAANTTNSSAVVTGLTQDQTNRLSIGMLVSGTGIQAGSTIIGITPGSGFTLSLTATATNSAVSLTMSPRVELRNLGSRSL
jgi:hypothetical protein